MQDRRSREFDRRGQDILAAALALFESDDWESVTVDEIARRAEVGKGTIYKHFSSKDDIYAQLAIDFQRQIVRRFDEIDTALPVIEALQRHLHVAWEAHLSRKDLHRVFLFCSRIEFRSRLAADTLVELERVEQQVTAHTSELIARGIAEGIFADQPPATLMFGAQAAFWGAIQLVWSGYLSEGDRSSQLDSLTKFLLAGLIYHDAITADALARPPARSQTMQPS